eukprot:gnl/Hemi2/18109_TR5984_c0_g1_i3.p1 gnl/Hemi2/18109_TR5984_c0_g1~~gnl/Hemi2/18109_TR5984_c0_g1_i3.p1  ORF type:complete len:469 (-),score=132.32 gnl/Hemi2/18109_TR5984_c0_g1_i3:126-1532(-)
MVEPAHERQPESDLSMEELTIDETLSQLDRIKKYVGSTIALQRLVHVRSISATARQVGFGVASTDIVPLLRQVATDDEPVIREAFADQIAELSVLFIETGDPAAYDTVVSTLLSLLQNLIHDSDTQVRMVAAEALLTISGKLRKEHLESRVATIVLALAHDGADEDNRILAIQILNELSTGLGMDLCQRYAAAEISPAFHLLVKDIQWKVRRTLAFSLHEIAKILDTAQVEAHLVTAFDLFLKDLDEVKVGVLRHLHDFVSLLTPAAREKYLTIYDHLQSESDSWRFRKYLARELPKLVKLYNASDVYSKLTTLAIRLCVDSVSRVRHEAYTSLAAIFDALKDKPEWKKEFGIKLAAFALQNSYQDRLIFVGACSHFLETCTGPAFETELLPRLLVLAKDKVPNVRLALARFMSEKLMSAANFGSNRELLATLGALKNDSDWDVSYFANGGGNQSLRKGHSAGPMVVT